MLPCTYGSSQGPEFEHRTGAGSGHGAVSTKVQLGGTLAGPRCLSQLFPAPFPSHCPFCGAGQDPPHLMQTESQEPPRLASFSSSRPLLAFMSHPGKVRPAELDPLHAWRNNGFSVLQAACLLGGGCHRGCLLLTSAPPLPPGAGAEPRTLEDQGSQCMGASAEMGVKQVPASKEEAVNL